MGVGGSGTAISVHLMTRPDPADRPSRIIMVGRTSESLDALRVVHRRIDDAAVEVRYVENADPAANDRLMGGLPPGSVVINATGMGKDLPGSPVTDQAIFPRDGVAWELNYRGELDFLRQAHHQQEARGLTVEDGWLYFLHGWSEVIAEVFHLEITPEAFEDLASEAVRG